jgi:Family of unknown function (DUF6092)
VTDQAAPPSTPATDSLQQNDTMFRLATFLVTAARDLVDEPAIYGPFRMLDAVDRLLAPHTDDAFIRRIQPVIAREKNTMMTDQDAFIAALDQLAAAFAAEAKRRNMTSSSGSGDPQGDP